MFCVAAARACVSIKARKMQREPVRGISVSKDALINGSTSGTWQQWAATCPGKQDPRDVITLLSAVMS